MKVFLLPLTAVATFAFAGCASHHVTYCQGVSIPIELSPSHPTSERNGLRLVRISHSGLVTIRPYRYSDETATARVGEQFRNKQGQPIGDCTLRSVDVESGRVV